MANTRETMGEQACLDALVARTLTSFEDDGVSSVGSNALRNYSALQDITLPNCKSVSSYGMANCANLEVVDMLGTGTISDSAFASDPKLTHLLLHGLTKTSFSGTASTIFSGTKIVTMEGAVYVPSSLISVYKADSFWGSYYIADIEDYPLSVFETISDPWSTIVSKCSNGDYATDYSIGDTKSIVIGENTYYMQLVAKDADVLASDGTTTVPTTWIMYRKMYSTTHRMNAANSSGSSGTGANGGWENCEMRSWLANDVFPLLPSDVKAGIKEVRKYSDYIVPGETTITHDQQTTDKLWIPSAREIVGGSGYEQSGPRYSNSEAGILNTPNNRIKYDSSGSPTSWWLRSASSKANWVIVTSSGNFDETRASNSYRVCLGFCI